MSLEISPNEIGFMFKTLNGKKFARKKVLEAFSKSAYEFYLAPTPRYFSPATQTTRILSPIYSKQVFPKVLPPKILTPEAQIASSNLQNRSFGLLLFVTILCQYSLLLNIRWFSGLSLLPLIRMNQSPSLFLDPLR